ncbi:hypothetical protein [Salinicoccus sp. RF5]|nr:hypothetical protein [Salinicoccus sp. RF5]
MQQMVAMSQEKAEYQILMSFSDIVNTTAFHIIAETGDIRRSTRQ